MSRADMLDEAIVNATWHNDTALLLAVKNGFIREADDLYEWPDAVARIREEFKRMSEAHA